MEIIGDYGKKYSNGYEYAMDRNRYDKPMGYDGDNTETINVSPSWNAWLEVVERNADIFMKMDKDDVDERFQWFDGGYQHGMVYGMIVGRR